MPSTAPALATGLEFRSSVRRRNRRLAAPSEDAPTEGNDKVCAKASEFLPLSQPGLRARFLPFRDVDDRDRAADISWNNPWKQSRSHNHHKPQLAGYELGGSNEDRRDRRHRPDRLEDRPHSATSMKAQTTFMSLAGPASRSTSTPSWPTRGAWRRKLILVFSKSRGLAKVTIVVLQHAVEHLVYKERVCIFPRLLPRSSTIAP